MTSSPGMVTVSGRSSWSQLSSTRSGETSRTSVTYRVGYAVEPGVDIEIAAVPKDVEIDAVESFPQSLPRTSGDP